MFDRAKEKWKQNERYIAAGALLLGFVIDTITLQRIDLLFENVVIIGYLVLAFLGIYSFNHIMKRRAERGDEKPVPLLVLALIQFAFGGLFSAYFIFYGRSGTLAASWAIIGLFALLLASNDFMRRWYRSSTFQLTLFYLALLSFLIFFIPIVTHSISVWSFMLAGFLSIVIMYAIIKFFTRIFQRTYQTATFGVATVFVLINIAYFTNVIPPIPLSLKDAGVFHSVERVSDGYAVQYEPATWYKFWRRESDTFHIRNEGDVTYVFASVFAPTDLNTQIFHVWSFFDRTQKRWIEADRFSYDITGGRNEGYRGYTLKRNLTAGRWRVDVENERGQLLGRKTFTVKRAREPLTLTDAVL